MLFPMLLLAAQAAQPAPAVAPPPRPPLGLVRADTNRDGVITRAEAQATADARFARFDTNRDGSVTPEERREFREAARQRPITAAEFQQRAAARFARLDVNRDGVLSGDERGDRRGRRGPRHHGPRGHDGPPPPGPDGAAPPPPPPPGMALTAAQFRTRALARFDRMDANRDGRIDAAEMAARRGQARQAK